MYKERPKNYEEVDVETIQALLLELRDLMDLLCEYFRWGTEFIEQDPNMLIIGYRKYGALTSACLSFVDKVLEMYPKEEDVS